MAAMLGLRPKKGLYNGCAQAQYKEGLRVLAMYYSVGNSVLRLGSLVSLLEPIACPYLPNQ